MDKEGSCELSLPPFGVSVFPLSRLVSHPSAVKEPSAIG